VQVPPLRVRPADIVDLERYFMRVLSKQKGVRLALTPEAERTLLGYSFPNNIVVRQRCGGHAERVGWGREGGVRGAGSLSHNCIAWSVCCCAVLCTLLCLQPHGGHLRWLRSKAAQPSYPL
jgi:hypothetical protein